MTDDDGRARDVLRGSLLFSELGEDVLAELIAGGTRHRYEAGERIAGAEDPADSCFVVVDGLVRLEMGGRTVAELDAGVAFGEAAVWDGGARGVDAVAATAVDVIELPSASMFRLVERDSGFAKRMLAYVVGVARRSIPAS